MCINLNTITLGLGLGKLLSKKLQVFFYMPMIISYNHGYY